MCTESKDGNLITVLVKKERKKTNPCSSRDTAVLVLEGNQKN